MLKQLLLFEMWILSIHCCYWYYCQTLSHLSSIMQLYLYELYFPVVKWSINLEAMYWNNQIITLNLWIAISQNVNSRFLEKSSVVNALFISKLIFIVCFEYLEFVYDILIYCLPWLFECFETQATTYSTWVFILVIKRLWRLLWKLFQKLFK